MNKAYRIIKGIIKCRHFVIAAMYLSCTFLPLFSGEVEMGSLMHITFGYKDYEEYVYALSACCMTFCALTVGYALRGIDCLVGKDRNGDPPLWASLFATITECVIMMFMKYFSFYPFGINAIKILTIFAVAITFEVLCIAVRFARGKARGKLNCGITIVAACSLVCACWTVFGIRAINGTATRSALAYFDARIENSVLERDELEERYNSLDDTGKTQSLVRIAVLDEEIEKLIQRRDELELRG